ncbi:MAG: MFS transporter [Acidimicrobiia bacterium]|nr:MFS transporter [Acidimicrobiia bacterium]
MTVGERAAASGVDDGSDAGGTGPVRELLADRNFRIFYVAQVLYMGANGTLRFAFIWLVVTLSDWPSVEGIIAIALGLPAMFLSLPAGAWSDRVDRKRMYIYGTALTLAALVAFTVIVATGGATAFNAGIAALVIGALISINTPNVAAVVPLLVPERSLMNAVALQNGGGQAASFFGLALGGVAISVFGDAGAFALLSVVTALSLVAMTQVTIPSHPEVPDGERSAMLRSIVDGAKFGFGSDPLRTLLILSVVIGGSFAVVQVSLPRVIEEDYGRSASAAGLVLGAFGVGMLASSIVVARRRSMRHGVNLATFLGIGLGLGQLLVGLSPNIALATLSMLAWGAVAGVAVASHRTLIQANTPPEMMGRVMGLMMLGFMGALPIGALVSSVLAPQLGPAVTMRVVGVATMAMTIPLTWRKSIVSLR